jgi:formylglycine-generating enzyme required for sulfatase activity
VRDALLKTLSGPATAEVVQKVSEWIEVCWDRCPNVPPFQAYLRDPSLLEESHPLASTAAFGQLTAEIIGRLPGPAYQQLAQKLRQGAAAPPPDPFPAASFRFEEIAVESATLQRLPGAEEELVYTTAQEQTAWLTECLYETAQLEAGVPVFTPARSWAYQEPLGPAAVFLDMLAIPPGRFTMGSPEGEPGRFADEGPQREVELSAFFLSRTPITQAQWRAVAQWQPLEEEDPWPMELDPDPVSGVSEAMRFQGDQRPVVNVSWRQAMAFCHRLCVRTGKHYTLPSEAQWEYACRAGTTTPFHFGATLSTKLANYDGNYNYADGQRGEYREHTTDVARFPANAWGLQDMHGNVWEWCLDHWHSDYKEAPCDGSAWLDSEVIESEASEENKPRLLRGGSWDGRPRYCRSAYRGGGHPDYRIHDVGFRLCCLPQD